MKRRPRVFPAVLLILTGCGLSNAMYNARLRMADADRAVARGDSAAARIAYLDAIERVAKVARDDDAAAAADAVFLVAKARTGLGEHAAAAAALRRVLETSASRPELRADAHALLGGALLALDEHHAAKAHLDSAVAALEAGEAKRQALLWRARVRFAAGDAGAWDDLAAARAGAGEVASAARVEAAGRAVQLGDSSLVRTTFRDLFDDPGTARSVDSIARFVAGAAARWGAAAAHALLDAASHAKWPPASRDSLLLVRARFAARVDPVAGIAEALVLADRAAAPLGDAARLSAARWTLADVADPDRLDDVRAMLLPATASPMAVDLLGALDRLDSLLELGRDGQHAIALFAAAELARDRLGAPFLAASLFRDYAAAEPDAVWAPKALLAAALLDPVDRGALEPMLARQPGNPYVAAWNGSRADGKAFADAEQRLARALAVVGAGDLAPEVEVGRDAATFGSRDSIRADGIRTGCGALVDSLAVTGIRADSVTAACLRGDTERVGVVLSIDTLLLRDTTSIRPDSVRARRPPRVAVDTIVRNQP